MKTNHYYVLGVNKDADLNKIKHAYRSAARQYHPDVTGGDPAKFRRVQEAFDVLSDESRRREYDQTESTSSSSERQSWKSPHVHHRPAREAASPFRTYPQQMSWDYNRFSSITDELLNGFAPGFYDRPVHHQKDFFMDLVLSPAEAIVGGNMQIEMPVYRDCPGCTHGRFSPFEICPECHGYGRIEDIETFTLFVPSGIQNGHEDSIPLDDIGLRGSRLNITIIVTA